MVILASQSPRRIELLKKSGIDFISISPNVSEDIDLSLDPVLIVETLALRKANSIFNQYSDSTIIGSDTIVYLNKVYGKPNSKEDAYDMLRSLSNKTHLVLTGVCIIKNKIPNVFHKIAKVTFKELSDKDIYDYIETNEPFDKAGSYAIQGIGSKLIKEYSGDINTIIGFPIDDIIDKL
jgi:septum formation protein